MWLLLNIEQLCPICQWLFIPKIINSYRFATVHLRPILVSLGKTFVNLFENYTASDSERPLGQVNLIFLFLF